MRRFSLVSISVAVAVLATLTVGSTVAPGAGMDATDIATDYVKDNKQQLGLTGADVNDMRVTNTVVDPGTRTTHVYFQQVHKDIGVYNGLLTVNVAADGWVVSSGNRFVPNLAAAAGGQSAKRADEAAEAAAKHVGLAPRDLRVVEDGNGTLEEEQGVERRRRRRTDRRRARLAADATPVASGWHGTSSSTRPAATTSGRSTWTPRPAPCSRRPTSSTRTRLTASRRRSPGPPARSDRWRFARPRSTPSRTARPTACSRSRSRAPRTATGRSCRTRRPRTRRPSAGTTRTARRSRVHAHAGQQRARVRRPRQQQRPRSRAPIRTAARGSTSTSRSTSTTRPLDSRDAAVTNLFYWNNIVHDVLYQHGFDGGGGQLPGQQLRQGRPGQRRRACRGPGRERTEQRELRDGRRRPPAPDADVRVALVAAEPDRGGSALPDRRDVLRPDGRVRREPRHDRSDLGPGRVHRTRLRPGLSGRTAARPVPRAGGREDRADRPRQLHLRREGEEGAGPGRADGDRREQRPRARRPRWAARIRRSRSRRSW